MEFNPVRILDLTTKKPITTVGQIAGICKNIEFLDDHKNRRRGLEKLKSRDQTIAEFIDIYMVIDNHSINVLRDLNYSPQHLISHLNNDKVDYAADGMFQTVMPASIKRNRKAKDVYQNTVKSIAEAMTTLKELNIPVDDYTGLRPMTTIERTTVKINLYSLMELAKYKMCAKSGNEFRRLFSEIKDALSSYSVEWRELIGAIDILHPECESLGYCPLVDGCGHMPPLDNYEQEENKLHENIV